MRPRRQEGTAWGRQRLPQIVAALVRTASLVGWVAGCRAPQGKGGERVGWEAVATCRQILGEGSSGEVPWLVGKRAEVGTAGPVDRGQCSLAPECAAGGRALRRSGGCHSPAYRSGLAGEEGSWVNQGFRSEHVCAKLCAGIPRLFSVANMLLLRTIFSRDEEGMDVVHDLVYGRQCPSRRRFVARTF